MGIAVSARITDVCSAQQLSVLGTPPLLAILALISFDVIAVSASVAIGLAAVLLAIDPHAGYLKGVLRVLSDVTVTVDHFHCVKLANAMVDDVQRRVQQSTLGHRGHTD